MKEINKSERNREKKEYTERRKNKIQKRGRRM